MTCPICSNKPMNCDCSKEAKELYYLREEMEQENSKRLEALKPANLREQERRELFKTVAISLSAQYSLWGDSYFKEVKSLTEAILKSADNFAKEEGGE